MTAKEPIQDYLDFDFAASFFQRLTALLMGFGFRIVRGPGDSLPIHSHNQLMGRSANRP